ncbi:MAG: hypothetical protein ACRCV7_00030 [Culicoidibacterales bacterium]
MKTLTTTEKINQIRTNDKINGMIEKAIELLQELNGYTDEFDDDTTEQKIDDLIAIFEAKDIRNTNESKRLCKEIINEQHLTIKETINEKEVY